MFKKLTLVALLVSVVSCFAFAQSANRKEIDKFFKDYEAVVVQAEKLAKTNSLNDLLKLEVKVTELAEQAEKFEEYDDWTLADVKKMSDLSIRYSNALMTVTNTMTETADSVGAMDLSAYGF